MSNGETRRRLAVHGPVIELDCTVPVLDESLDALVGPLTVDVWQENFRSLTGVVHPYEESEVLSRLPDSARHITRTSDQMDIFEDGNRYWLVDDRWGMCEIDIARDQWRSWIVPNLKLDPIRVAELSVLWPMAQLLRSRGLHMVPAVSMVRDGFAVLLICPFGLEPELKEMIHHGYKLIGQRWTALRVEDGRVALLHIPGMIERFTTPRLRFADDERESWIDVTRERPGSRQNHAFCDAVLIAEHGRRSKAHLRETQAADAVNLLRDAWPISELHPLRRVNPMPALLAEHCPCYEVQLSRNTKDLLALLNSVRFGDLSEEQSVAA